MTSDLQLLLQLKVSLERLVTGWPNAEQGENTFGADLIGVDLTKWDQAYIAKIALAGGASVTVDLRNFTTLLSEAGVAFARVFGMFVKPTLDDPALTNASLTIKPGAANGLQWFFTNIAEGVTIKPGDTLIKVSAPTDVTGFTVDATHKTLTFSNPGTHALTATVIILGGTT